MILTFPANYVQERVIVSKLVLIDTQLKEQSSRQGNLNPADLAAAIYPGYDVVIVLYSMGFCYNFELLYKYKTCLVPCTRAITVRICFIYWAFIVYIVFDSIISFLV